MCIAYISIAATGWPIKIAANRDEFHARPTTAMQPWPDIPAIIAGRDLQAGGTWLGWAQGGRFAFLTNFREPSKVIAANAPSRGALVTDFLAGTSSPYKYAKQLLLRAQDWAGFNLVIGSSAGVWYISNRNIDNSIDSTNFTDVLVASANSANFAGRLQAGDYIISNHLLNTPWPKAIRLKRSLQAIADNVWRTDPGNIFGALYDTDKADIQSLPSTGISTEFELLLSSPFIISPEYGTRCSSIIYLENESKGLISELSYNCAGEVTERHDWPLEQ